LRSVMEGDCFNLQASQHFTVFAFIVKRFRTSNIPTLPLFSRIYRETLSHVFRAPLPSHPPPASKRASPDASIEPRRRKSRSWLVSQHDGERTRKGQPVPAARRGA
ncbi:hypothetical protein ABLN72_11365, partial [Mycobacterium tuberculosis]